MIESEIDLSKSMATIFRQENTFQISDMTKTFSLLLSLVFVATAQHLDSTRRGGEKVGEYLDQAVDSRIIYPGYFR